ncbi:hypothetical protein KSP40_PGU009551 [Platanthera guangdongensis]|uniref:Uncharacterized protein n=1 Tax=Platanthera guangdongensis TaxID=2320717 RepID=A0ABR2N3N1_9ASPA
MIFSFFNPALHYALFGRGWLCEIMIETGDNQSKSRLFVYILNIGVIDTQFEVAKLLDVCWLEIHGKLYITYLNPGVRYKVVFVVKMEEHGYGWDNPVNLRLKLPEKSSQIYTQSLKDLSKKEWTELKAGIITADTERRGEMQFSLYDYTGGLWKRGLLVKGVKIKQEDYISSRDMVANGSMAAQNDQRMAQSETKEKSSLAVKRALGEKKYRRTS